MAGAVFEAAGVYEEVIAPMVSEALSWCPGSTAARDFANYYAASSNGALQNITERANQLRCFAEELIEAKRAQCTLPCLSRRAMCRWSPRSRWLRRPTCSARPPTPSSVLGAMQLTSARSPRARRAPTASLPRTEAPAATCRAMPELGPSLKNPQGLH